MPLKFAFGLLLLGLGFLVMVGAAKLVTAGNEGRSVLADPDLPAPHHGVNSASAPSVSVPSPKLAPKRFVGQMMGIWFLATALGNLIAGLMAGRFNPEALDEMPSLFLQIVLVAVGAGLLLFLLTKPIKKLAGDVQ